MLQELNISQFAIIEQQTITFAEGLNVITGETGSGKSVLLHALEVLLGAKPRTSIVRQGSEQAEVSALFDLSKLSIEIFNSLPEIAQTEELVINRIISLNGKSKVYINGRLGSLQLLSEITQRLVNVCGQNQFVRLLEPRYHLELVDNFAANQDLRVQYQGIFRSYNEVSDQVKQAQQSLLRSEQRQQELQSIVDELSSFKVNNHGIRAGIRKELEAEVRALSNAESLISGLHSISEMINAPEGLFEQLSQVATRINELTKLDHHLLQTTASFINARTEIKEFEHDLRHYLRGIEVNEELLEAKREMLAEIARLERKYKLDDAGLEQLLSTSSRELVGDSAGMSIEALLEKQALLQQELSRVAALLSSSRKKAAQQLAKQVATELADLNMNGTRIEASIEKREFNISGADQLELLFSANPGEPLKALAEIASGGELSRVMLVLKKVLRERSGVNILVFDEVDSGVSGSVARAVGDKLLKLSQSSQVICITHLPQVASLADHHLVVSKQKGSRTNSVVYAVKADQQIEEIAKMLSGYMVTEHARESARELLTSKSYQ